MSITPVLFEKKENCCGCGACLNICPQKAIVMKSDECGFIYPTIDKDKCIHCGKCQRVCAFQNIEEKNIPIECFAAVSENKEQVKLSASGGIFAAVATKIIEKGGIVYGAAFDENWNVHHIAAESIDQLSYLQGSKYVHSDIERVYSEAKEQLQLGRRVLFSGTPCQVAGFNGYLGKKYDNLLTIDIVCHGVPSNKMFQEYLKTLENKYDGKITNFVFRDKSIGWGINGSTVINGKKKKIWQSASSYLYYFTKGWIYRENCYKCKYACSNRPSDLTIGDCWGIEKQHPELIGRKGWDAGKGVSLIIVNTNLGADVLNETDEVQKRNVSFDELALYNEQLRKPSDLGKREDIICIYSEHGWSGLEKRFLKKIGIKKYSSFIKCIIPSKIKSFIKRKTSIS